jgi:nucleoside-diphosphate-sugar epimerase
MKILVLGAGGLIGCHLTHRLLQERHAVTAVDLETTMRYYVSEYRRNGGSRVPATV